MKTLLATYFRLTRGVVSTSEHICFARANGSSLIFASYRSVSLEDRIAAGNRIFGKAGPPRKMRQTHTAALPPDVSGRVKRIQKASQ
jgi:hypothetical protein